MKQILLNETGGVDKLKLVEAKKPIPGEGEVLVKIHAASVNFIDTIIREGNMPPGMMPELPFVPGVEGTGVIEDANGTGLEVGQKVGFLGVIGSATYAEYALVKADKLVVLPDTIDLNAAAVIPVNYVTAYHMFKNVAKVKEGDKVIVYAAAGGVGTALVQISKILGVEVIALERRDEKVKTALEMGAKFAFNTSKENWVDDVKKTVGENAIQHVFNPVAGDSVQNDLELLAPLGNIVIFGILGGYGKSSLMEETFKYFSKAPTLSFSEIYATYFNEYNKIEEALKQLYAWLEEGKISPVYSILPLEDAVKAHEMIESGKVRGKLLLVNS